MRQVNTLSNFAHSRSVIDGVRQSSSPYVHFARPSVWQRDQYGNHTLSSWVCLPSDAVRQGVDVERRATVDESAPPSQGPVFAQPVSPLTTANPSPQRAVVLIHPDPELGIYAVADKRLPLALRAPIYR